MTLPRYSRVAIIGAGPAGMASAKALALEPIPFTAIDVYERQSQWGGVWNYQAEDKNIENLFGPSNLDVELSEYVLSMYTHLETNLKKRLMEFLQMPFPGGDFPNRETVYTYLNEYGDTIPKTVNFKFNCHVDRVEKVGEVWKITSQGSTEDYDAIIIANGHFDLPYIPEIPGLEEWNNSRPETISHAKYFTDAECYRDKTVVLVGNSYLGVDIAAQVGVYAKKVYVSCRTPAKIINIAMSLVTEVGMIAKFDPKEQIISMTDGSVIDGVDDILFCTGCHYHIPFLKTYSDIVTTRGVRGLYHQIFYSADPSLLFVALQNGAVPFPVLELQGAVIARVYSGRMTLPPISTMETELAIDYDKRGDAIHFFDYPDDVDLYRFYYQLLANKPGLLEQGLVPVYWDEELRRVREVAAATKIARMRDIYLWAESLRSQGKPFTLAPHQQGKFGH